MTEVNPHARVDINKVIVVDMFKTERTYELNDDTHAQT